MKNKLSKKSLKKKIKKYDKIIIKLEDSIIEHAGIEKYQLDDGKYNIKTTYNCPRVLAIAIKKFSLMRKQMIYELKEL